MKDINFRRLTADEIECRVQSSKNGKTRLLLYIDSRAVVTLLNETVGLQNWTTEFVEVNGLTICKLGLWDEDKKMFVYKSDTGAESNIEASKGLISDAYKRCLARLGVTELYTTPEIIVPEVQYEKYHVTNLEYKGDSRTISALTIADSKGTTVFNWTLEGGTTTKVFKMNNKTADSKDEEPKATGITTEDELRNFFKEIKNRAGSEWETVKPSITAFLNYYREKLPILKPESAWKKWVSGENVITTKEACLKTTK